MQRRTLLTILFIGVVVVGLVAALFQEAMRGATFRAEDYATYDECVRGIPAEWRQGSLERSGAEDACGYLELRRRRQ